MLMNIVIARIKEMMQSLYMTLSLADMSFRHMPKLSGVFMDTGMRRCDGAQGCNGAKGCDGAQGCTG